jgi:hypothetical protein
MQTNLLKKTMLFTMISASLAGCGSDTGKDYNFSADMRVEFPAEALEVSIDEVSGIIEIDLLAGATAGGQPLDIADSTVYVRNFRFAPLDAAFRTPQTAGIVVSQPISPFFVSDDNTKLVVVTDGFNSALRMCDDTDVRGAVNADGDNIADGVRDFPQSITYSVHYVIDNGFDLEPGEEPVERELLLTINAITDPVTSVQAFNTSVASGDTTEMLAATLPTYACNSNLTYEITDATTASIDGSGNVTGNNKGETTITVTSAENSELSATANITVTPGFNLAIKNQDFNDLGAPLGTKSVPTCSAIGIAVEPTIVADDLTGAYTYSWVSDSQTFAMEETDGAFGATGRFDNSLATGETATVTVGYDSGYTGATSTADVQDQMVTVTAERNYVCEPPTGVPTAQVDLLLNAGGWGPNATHVAGGLDADDTALLVTSNNDDKAQFGNTTRQVWNQGNNFHAQTFGRGAASVGRTFKFAVWAKLSQLPADPTEELKLEHTLLAWNCTGCGVTGGFPGRYTDGVTGTVSAVLEHTTEWQLVEFINPLTDTMEWTVPAIWGATTATFQFWDLYGFGNGDSIALDNYSIVEVE